MLNQLCTFSSTARMGLLSLGAAILLSACGGSTDLGNGPEMLKENLPSNVTVSAANANSNLPTSADAAQEQVFDWRSANGGPAPGQEADTAAAAASAATTADAATTPAAASEQASAQATTDTVAQDQAGAARPCLDLPSCNGMLPTNVNDKEQAWQQGGGPY